MSFKLHIRSYIFEPKLITTLLALICIPILISLGFWQLDRADEKRVIDQGVNDAIAKSPLPLNNADLTKIDDEIYRRTSIDGYYNIKQQFLLDNRTHKGSPGYHVISPFIFESKYSNIPTQYGVLINRGWIGYKGTRDQITDISLEKELTKIIGSLKRIPRSIVLNENEDKDSLSNFVFKAGNKQLVDVNLIQAIQIDSLEKNLDYKLLPVMIELDKTAENGFVREWQPYFGSIDKHNAYALQWFAMASILFFLYIKLNTRKR